MSQKKILFCDLFFILIITRSNELPLFLRKSYSNAYSASLASDQCKYRPFINWTNLCNRPQFIFSCASLALPPKRLWGILYIHNANFGPIWHFHIHFIFCSRYESLILLEIKFLYAILYYAITLLACTSSSKQCHAVVKCTRYLKHWCLLLISKTCPDNNKETDKHLKN